LRSRLPFIVFLVAAAIGLVLSVAAYRSGAQADYLRFERYADEALDRISQRVVQHISLLTATRSLFEAQQGDVSHRQFASFVRHLDIEENYDGVLGIGYSALIQPDGDDWVRATLLANYSLDRAPFPPSSNELRAAIVMFEPSDEQNRAALGYDLYTDPVLREAMQAALRTGSAQASGKIPLPEIGINQKSGIFVFLPIGDRGTGQAVMPNDGGFIFAAFGTEDLIRSALIRGTWLPVHVEIRDANPDSGALLFESASAAGSYGEDYVVRREFDIAGRQWHFEISPSGDFRKGRATGVALLLGTVSLLLAAALSVSIRSQLKALEASREVLRISQDAANQKDFLLQEMRHRIKNSIARVLAIARQTASGAATVEEFNNSFTNRLQAMATSQDLISSSQGEKVDLAELLESELQQVFGDSLHDTNITGPQQRLGARSAQALALVFHELATNALKYANMECPGNRLDIKWTNGGSDEALEMDWQEYVASDMVNSDNSESASGFGTRLMRSLVEVELSGTFSQKFTPQGLRVHINIPDPRH
jgi:CHASE1-domain containing sensor protein